MGGGAAAGGAAAPAAGAAKPAAAAAAAAPPKEEKTHVSPCFVIGAHYLEKRAFCGRVAVLHVVAAALFFLLLLQVDIKLKTFDQKNKIKVIKEIRGVTNLGLKEVSSRGREGNSEPGIATSRKHRLG